MEREFVGDGDNESSVSEVMYSSFVHYAVQKGKKTKLTSKLQNRYCNYTFHLYISKQSIPLPVV